MRDRRGTRHMVVSLNRFVLMRSRIECGNRVVFCELYSGNRQVAFQRIYSQQLQVATVFYFLAEQQGGLLHPGGIRNGYPVTDIFGTGPVVVE